MRVTPIAMAVGQAGGTAAALSSLKEISVSDVDINELRETLIENGVFLENYQG